MKHSGIHAALTAIAILASWPMPASCNADVPSGEVDPSHWVDPFIGLDARPGYADGAIFIGAAAPFGMLKAGPDRLGADWGWTTGSWIDGFSQTHTSGTGGGGEYGNFSVQPSTGALIARGLASDYADEHAEPGRFKVRLKRWAVNVDIIAGRRSALYDFAFDPTAQANLVIDIGHVLSSCADCVFPDQGERGLNQHLIDSAVTITSATTLEGRVTGTSGWNLSPKNYTLYFSAQLDQPASADGVIDNGVIRPNRKAASVSGGAGTGAYFTYTQSKAAIAGMHVRLKLALSMISSAQARATLTTEQPDFDLERADRSVKRQWNDALAAVEVTTPDTALKRQLYTALYHAMLMPTDRTGENPLWQSPEPAYDDYYTIWDIFRTTSPFLGLIAPERQAAIVRSLIDIHRHEGWLPDARNGNADGVTQGGSNADVMIADALARGLPGINWEDAYAAVRTDAEQIPPDPLRYGRRGLEDWKTRGYLLMENSDLVVSRQVEYALNDWCVAQLARHLGKMREYRIYLNRSNQWRNLFDPTFTHEGFKGFLVPRQQDGHFVSPYNPLATAGTGGQPSYEDSSWTYSFFVPHDVKALVGAMGGRETFVRRLDHLFATPKRYYVGNEPSFLLPYFYIWAGRHDKTAERLHATLVTEFNDSRSGLPGNDDSGAMSTWYLLAAIGLFPNAGSDVWLIGSPSVEKTTLAVGNGKTFTIEAPGATGKAIYVRKATLNGKKLDRAWLRHADLTKGGVLRLEMAETPGAWPTGAPPPSQSD